MVDWEKQLLCMTKSLKKTWPFPHPSLVVSYRLYFCKKSLAKIFAKKMSTKQRRVDGKSEQVIILQRKVDRKAET